MEHKSTADYEELVNDAKTDVRTVTKNSVSDMDTTPKQRSGHLIICLCPEFERIISMFAERTSRCLLNVTELMPVLKREGANGYGSITLCGKPSDFTADALSLLWQLEAATDSVFGILACREVHELQRWVRKRLHGPQVYTGYAGVVSLTRDSSTKYATGLALNVSEKDFGPEDVGLIKTPRQLIIMEFHSKECCARFNDHVFCGLPIDAPNTLSNRLTGSLPGCACGYPCVWHYERIHFSLINAVHVAAISCGSLRLGNPLFDHSVGLGLNIFHSVARSFLSPVRFVVSNALLSSILEDYYSSGIPLGRVAKHLNRLLAEWGQDGPNFVLLGDPLDTMDLSSSSANYEPRINIPMAEEPTLIDDPSACQHKWLEACPSDPKLLFQHMAAIDATKGFWLSLKYRPPFTHKYEAHDVVCLWCDERSMRYKRQTASLEVREIVTCPRCGIIADVPAGFYGSCQLLAPTVLSSGGNLCLLSELYLPSGDVPLVAGFSLIHSSNFGWSAPWPEILICKEFPGTYRIAMNCHVPGTAYPFVYWLRVTWITGQTIFWMSRPLTISATSIVRHQ